MVTLDPNDLMGCHGINFNSLLLDNSRAHVGPYNRLLVKRHNALICALMILKVISCCRLVDVIVFCGRLYYNNDPIGTHDFASIVVKYVTPH